METSSNIDKNPDEICKDPSDGRKPGDWTSRYNKDGAMGKIYFEAGYLLTLLIIVCIIAITLGIQCKNQFIKCDFALSPTVHSYCFAWVGGMLGGIVFASKWLYHTVAKGIWNIDRRLWRVLSPLLSGVLAVMFVVIICCFNTIEVFSIQKSCGIGFLVGYFSDTAIGKLSELANVFFAKQ